MSVSICISEQTIQLPYTDLTCVIESTSDGVVIYIQIHITTSLKFHNLTSCHINNTLSARADDYISTPALIVASTDKTTQRTFWTCLSCETKITDGISICIYICVDFRLYQILSGIGRRAAMLRCWADTLTCKPGMKWYYVVGSDIWKIR